MSPSSVCSWVVSVPSLRCVHILRCFSDVFLARDTLRKKKVYAKWAFQNRVQEPHAMGWAADWLALIHEGFFVFCFFPLHTSFYSWNVYSLCSEGSWGFSTGHIGFVLMYAGDLSQGCWVWESLGGSFVLISLNPANLSVPYFSTLHSSLISFTFWLFAEAQLFQRQMLRYVVTSRFSTPLHTY